MTKQEQIEEIGKVMCEEFRSEHCGNDCECANEYIAEKLYNAGYRKIDDKCAVITKDDLKLYKKQAVKEFAEKLKSEMLDREYNGIHYKWGAFSDNDIDELLKDYLK